MIQLRKLKIEDANLMLEWMHDPQTQKGFKKNMLSTTLETAKKFCLDSAAKVKIENGDSVHYAIANDNDEYLGTISLKSIDLVNLRAEFAVVLRPCIQRKGIAKEATRLILEKAFYEYKLHRVYLTVLSDNVNAIKLYEKCGFKYEGELRDHLMIDGSFKNWKLYGILDNEFLAMNKQPEL